MEESKELWIGIEVPIAGGDTMKICVGINLEEGNEISYTNTEYINFHKKEGGEPWRYDEAKVVVSEDAVFDKNHKLIEK